MATALKLIFLSAISFSGAFPLHTIGNGHPNHEGIISNLFHLPLRVVGSFLDIGEDFVGDGLKSHNDVSNFGGFGSLAPIASAVPVTHVGIVPAQGIVSSGIVSSPGPIIHTGGIFGGHSGAQTVGYPVVNPVVAQPVLSQPLLYPSSAGNIPGNTFSSGAVPAVNAVPAVGSFSHADSASSSFAGNSGSWEGNNGGSGSTASASARVTTKAAN